MPIQAGDIVPKKMPLCYIEVDDINKMYNFTVEEASAVDVDVAIEVRVLSLVNTKKDKRITYLEGRVMDLEQYMWVGDM